MTVIVLCYQALRHRVYKLAYHVGLCFLSSALYGLIKGTASRFPSIAVSTLLGSLTLVDRVKLTASDNINYIVLKVRIVGLEHERMLIFLLSPDSEVELYAGSHHIKHHDDELWFDWGRYQASKE